ncbi:TRAP transporter large permease [Oribacterium sp. WCC10]|uniref:TRAP transporter large permease n=1 Tax=Oribacterium sp. WCC10 TaxID=1855343 RepID=UPI0008F33D1C|nr:TRAP transporter large permease [Oribacterium sp. WCC10]SFG53752.1 TRAP transporter, DctM subunit [Oribacterium sp. WCC10]
MIVFLLTFLVLLLIGAPISIAIGAGATAGCIALGYPLQIVGQKMVTGIDSYLLIAVPLFIFAGNLMNEGKITTKIFDFAKALVGWIPGGLGHANIVASIIFAGMSGSAAADAGGLGVIEMKAMRDNGYDDEFSAAVTSASSVIGPIFPPSIPLIIYGSVASVSVAKLFMGGVIPGLLMGFALMVLVFIFAVKRGYEKSVFSFKVLTESFKGSILSLVTPIIILAGFTTGWITPTEASCIAVLYSLLISAVVYKTLGIKDFIRCAKDSAVGAANTLFIIGTSTLFTYVMVKEGISRDIADFILGISTNQIVILLIINIILLILGMFMEPGAILTLMLPVLVPIAQGIGLDLVHFGVVMVLNLMIGQVTPPFGVCLFIISDLAHLKLEVLYKGILPFIIPLIVTLMMCTYIPGIVTWLPNMLLGA